jgi:hypothetical protein
MCGAFAAVTDVLILEHLSFVFEFFSSPAARARFSLFTLPHRTAAVFRQTSAIVALGLCCLRLTAVSTLALRSAGLVRHTSSDNAFLAEEELSSASDGKPVSMKCARARPAPSRSVTASLLPGLGPVCTPVPRPARSRLSAASFSVNRSSWPPSLQPALLSCATASPELRASAVLHPRRSRSGPCWRSRCWQLRHAPRSLLRAHAR